MNSVKVLNVRVDNYTLDELLSSLKKGVVVTPNLDHIVLCQKNEEFHRCAAQAEYSIADSKYVVLAARLRGLNISEAIPGASFFPRFCDYHAKNPSCKIFLLGAAEGVAEKAKININTRIGRDIINGVYSPYYGFENSEEECLNICNRINESGANVVLVGLGNPKQTTFIYKYKDQMPNVDIWLALGSTIDFEAGNISRAPIIFQKLALEWLYRVITQPKRTVPRVIKDFSFFYYFFKQLIGLYKDPFAE